MKRLSTSTAFFMTLPALAAASSSGIPVKAASAVFARAHALCSADGGRLWGISLCGPLIFADPRTHAAIANVPVPGATRIRGLYRFTLPAGIGVSDTWLQYRGIRFAEIMWPPMSNPAALAVTLMHESFHRIQPELGFVIKGARDDAITISGDAALDTETGRIWFRGELHALRAALTSRGPERRRALTDALELRAYRHALLPATIRPEHELDVFEGLAESTGIDVGLPPSRRLAYTLHDIRFVERSSNYARTFCYAIGPAYSELLDSVTPNWRHRITMHTSIAALAARAYGIDVVTPDAAHAHEILARFGGAAIEREEAARAAQEKMRDTEYRAQFLDGPTLRLPLGRFSMDYRPAQVRSWGSMGFVYRKLTVRSLWGRIAISHGRAWINRTYSELTVIAPAITSGRVLHGKGWVLTLSSAAQIVPDRRRPGSYVMTLRKAVP